MKLDRSGDGIVFWAYDVVFRIALRSSGLNTGRRTNQAAGALINRLRSLIPTGGDKKPKEGRPGFGRGVSPPRGVRVRLDFVPRVRCPRLTSSARKERASKGHMIASPIILDVQNWPIFSPVKGESQ